MNVRNLRIKIARKYNLDPKDGIIINKRTNAMSDSEHDEYGKLNKRMDELRAKYNKYVDLYNGNNHDNQLRRINPENPRRRLW